MKRLVVGIAALGATLLFAAAHAAPPVAPPRVDPSHHVDLRAGATSTHAVEVPTGATMQTTCSGSVLHTSVCTRGGCIEALAAPCAPYGCDAKKVYCTTKCTSDADCSAGGACNVASGQCVFTGNRCQDPFTVIEVNGSVTSCVPYTCKADRCWQVCSTNAECSSGYSCISGSCVK